MLDTISMADKLKGDYRKVFEKADMYSSVAGGDLEENDEKIMNLYDVLIQAQQEEKPIEKIIGSDLEEFCMSYFEREEETKEKWYIVIPKTIYGIMKVVFICTLIWMLPSEDTGSVLEMKQNVSPYIAGVVLGFALVFIGNDILKKVIFKSKKIKPIVFYFIIILNFVIGVIISVMVSDLFQWEISSKTLLLISLGYMVVYLLVRSIWRYTTFGTIRRETKEVAQKRKDEKQQTKLFNKEVSDESLYMIMAEGMAKRYLRLQRKKGITFAEFAEKIRKEERQQKKIDVAMILFYAVMILGPAIAEMINNNVFQGLLLGLLLTAVEVPIYLFLKKNTDRSSANSIRIIEECEKKEMDIVEYSKELKEN
ncbi:MAG: hypothetical protein IJA32_03295 [Lachnospiraceae bacterium]|nr:hypothetical protein [Lachnospiraceae bacterium]